jgi:DNA polymerase-1
MSAPLLVADGPSLLYRAFYALPDSITDAEGRPVNALLGMTNLLLWVIERRRPRATVLCFGLEAATYRQELYPPYHADRPPVPDGLAGQFAQVEDFFGAFGFHVAGTDAFEADDLLGAYAQVEAGAGGQALLLTGDRDMYQCATDDVTVLYVKTGSGGKGPEEVGPDEVVKRYGVPPEAVPDFIALRGDPSDGLPGAKGIGEKTAADLLRRHRSLEAVIEGALRERPGIRKAIFEHADQLRAYREIATLRPVDVDRPPDTPVDWERAAEAARERGMNRLAERLDKEGATA